MNILIIGGGLSGILVSAALRKKDISHDLVESQNPWTGSRASSGILNPVMGRKRQRVANQDLLASACAAAYGFLEQLLGLKFFHPVEILEFLAEAEMRPLFEERAQEFPELLRIAPLPDGLSGILKIAPGTPVGITSAAFQLDTLPLQTHYLERLRQEGRLIETLFDPTDIPAPEGDFVYKGRQYSHLVYCTGKHFPEISENGGLPLSPNKGQALLLEIADDLPRNHIYKLGSKLTLCPWGEQYWWAGASFEWTHTAEGPTAEYAQQMQQRLQEIIRSPFRVVEQVSGFRVSSRDRRAVSGWLSAHPRIGVVNAMGTKGVLQAPQAAEELVEKLLHPEAREGLFPLSRFRSVKDAPQLPDRLLRRIP